MVDQQLALQALMNANFDWTVHMQNIWRDSPYDVESLHQDVRAAVVRELSRIQQSSDDSSPLGMILVGSAGAGKTHLLSTLRQHALANNSAFVLVDMTDVHDFWATALQGYVDSLQEQEADGVPQYHKLLNFLATQAKAGYSREHLAQAERRHIGWYINQLLSALSRHYRRDVIKHQDIIRSLILLNSDDFTISNIGYSWLLGLGIDDEDSDIAKFSSPTPTDPSRIVEGLSWLMNLRGSTLLAFDQLDSIVTQHYLASNISDGAELADEQYVSKAIIEGISGGLMGLRDKTRRTLTLVSCLEETWNILSKEVVKSVQGRFLEPMILGPVLRHQIAEQMIAYRLQKNYTELNFSPPYPTWPFAPKFFDEAREFYPRRLLQRCHQHREYCLAQAQVTELTTTNANESLDLITDPISFAKVDHAFAAAKQKVLLTALHDENHEDDHFGELLQFACQCLLIENPLNDDVDARVDVDFPGGKNKSSLHARLCLTYRTQSDRENHLSIRALQRTHHAAFKSRLKAALTTSGIDRRLSFRRLLIARTLPFPGGKTVNSEIERLEKAGGAFVNPTDDELQTLGALYQLSQENITNFTQWIQERRPISQLSFLADAVAWLFPNSIRLSPGVDSDTTNLELGNGYHATEGHTLNDGNTELIIVPGKTSDEATVSLTPLTSDTQRLPIGHHLIGEQTKEAIMLNLEELTKHTVILAGSGSGKTVLIKRITEEAALCGIPAIVIDGANDLARMGDPWPTAPDSWTEEDKQKANCYQQQVQVAIWTPGLERGNPLNLEPIPDLAAVVGEIDEFDLAIDMARDGLQEIVAPGNSHTSTWKRGILRSALVYFAHHGGGTLTDFIELLANLPTEAGGEISNAPKHAQAMADSLRAEVANNPLLRQTGAALDPALLFGLNKTAVKTQVSVINLSGLIGLSAQQQFVNQLAMTLFTWIKKHPAPPNAPLRGLLILDEAKDFVPSGSTTICKTNLLRLVAQARKYGLGLVFATQAPKSIDHNIIANCSIQFYGRANSPAAIDTVQEQLRQRGGDGQDIGQLRRGQFYTSAETLSPPVKVQTPLCLSYHAATPLDEQEIVKRAAASRIAF